MQDDNGVRIINRIAKDVSSRICTAQVVTSASSAVRQLVDNAIDAKAKSIEIRVIDNGFNSIEVADDGSGIDPSNFDTICKPHATSKLTDYSDFQELTTLGFRGEALNALCALGSLSILTRSKEALVGTKLTFDHKGQQISNTNTAKPVGTTVTVTKLFETLPVRRKEFEKTQKKEFGRIISTVQCFALSRPEIRFILSNNVGGKRQQVLCTPGGVGLKEVVSNLFGGRTDKNKMLDLEKDSPDEEICSIYGVNSVKDEEYDSISLSGYISSCEHGYGRSSTDRQFLYFNKRPVDYPKVCRAINEVYQAYNKSQYPTLVLFVDVPPESIDVNVTPDKRTVFYDKERVLLAIIRASVLSTLKQVLGTFTTASGSQSAVQTRLTRAIQSTLNRSESSDLDSSRISLSSSADPLPSVYDLLRSANLGAKRTSTFDKPEAKRGKTSSRESAFRTLESFSFSSTPNNTSLSSSIATYATRSTKNNSKSNDNDDSEGISTTVTEATFLRHLTPDKRTSTPISKTPTSSAKKTSSSSSKKKDSVFSNSSNIPTAPASKDLRNIFSPQNEREGLLQGRTSLMALSRGSQHERSEDDERVFKALETRLDSDENQASEHTEDIRQAGDAEDIRQAGDAEDNGSRSPKIEILSQTNAVMSQLNDNGTFMRPQQTVPFDLETFNERMNSMEARRVTKEEIQSQIVSEAVFQAALEPESNEKAEKELTQILKKSDFNDMNIIGQFNKGFIIARLRNNLFIIDQHASDEKFNFERFQKKACVDNQKLLQPSPLNFGALQESALRDNISIFRANGFDFDFKEQPDGGTLAYLTSVPVLNSWQFDRSDIEEILSFVQEFPGEMYRPSKLQKIFASRACRKSVMIGTGLNHKQMESIVRNLAKLDQPWNCPHGRPTLRHLGDISHVFSDVNA